MLYQDRSHANLSTFKKIETTESLVSFYSGIKLVINNEILNNKKHYKNLAIKTPPFFLILKLVNIQWSLGFRITANRDQSYDSILNN